MNDLTNIESNYFVDLARINVSQYVEKKGQFSYLSWSFAIDQLKRYDPEATWRVLRFPVPGATSGPEIPYMITPNGCFVEVEVTVKGMTLSQLQPVMDFKNKAMANPDVMDVNKAIQRCLVKGIAVHGLGLYIYSGEDLPNDLLSGTQHRLISEAAEEFARLRGVDISRVIGSLNIPSINHLTTGQADVVLDKLKEWKQMAKEKEAAEAAKAETGANTPKKEEAPTNA